MYVHSNQVTQKRLILLFSVSGSNFAFFLQRKGFKTIAYGAPKDCIFPFQGLFNATHRSNDFDMNNRG